MYYTDKGGHSVTAREVTRAEYEQVIGTMSEADKAGLNQAAQLFAKDISKIRLEREYERLYKLGEELENAANRLDQIKRGASFEREGVLLNNRTQVLQEEIAGVINDIAQEAKTSPRTLWQILGYRYPQVSRWAK